MTTATRLPDIQIDPPAERRERTARPAFSFLDWVGNPCNAEAVHREWVRFSEEVSWWLDGELCDLFVHGRTADTGRIESEFVAHCEDAFNQGRI